MGRGAVVVGTGTVAATAFVGGALVDTCTRGRIPGVVCTSVEFSINTSIIVHSALVGVVVTHGVVIVGASTLGA